ncbi:MAG TPA: hypothetical protein DCZ92_07495 [Elusimicrobia bacterium]|nr:MAG: hypothetical protein A2016_10600 [Elusimicrobia bacterium GWF2_62_30]HBA60650.1 hypothetical protein [Elusimicrobiota bacterium]
MPGKLNKLILAAALLLAPARAAFSGIPMAGGDNSIRRSLVSGGGAISAGAGFSLNCALAENVVSTFTGAGFKFSSGLMPLAAQPGTITALTAVTKSTGTLELNWTAPGLDGFQGAVAGGTYRIDTTSDPAHVFAPTVFVTQFSTAVTPGDQQAYVFSGLQANTTYYTRIYLADIRTVVAEDSDHSDESTLANLPVTPELAGVYASSVSFTWNVPAGAAEGYRVAGSSGNFGALFPGGVVYTSTTENGLLMTLTVRGLRPETTYYFKLASLNWQQETNYGVIIATCTRRQPRPYQIEGLTTHPLALARKVLFNWTTPDYPDLAGVLVQTSTAPITQELEDYTAYNNGAVLADGSVVLASAAAVAQAHTGLLLDSTYYYNFSSKDANNVYSLVVSTECLLDLPPMSPGGLQASLDPARTEITISWSGVTSNNDGSMFRFSGEPLELARYEIYRATGLMNSNWALVTSVAVSSMNITVPVPDPASVYYYKVAAVDSIGVPGTSMIVDTDKNLYAMAPDMISRIRIPADLTRVVTPGGNSAGSPLFFAALDRTADEGGKVMKAVEFAPIQAPSGAELDAFTLDTPRMDIVLRYETEAGMVVPSGLKGAAPEALAAYKPSVDASDASSSLGAYWYNGKDYVKVFGSVNTADQTVTVRSAVPGKYQIRTLARSSGVSFDVKEMSNKVITPNGDGRNDYVVFTLDNPRDSSITGKIYDLSGAFVADMKPGTQIADTLAWDGKSNGSVVPRGVYVYQIKAEGKTFNGTLVVIR